MLRIKVSTLIGQPVQEVWDLFIDLTNSPRWTRSGSELRQRSAGPIGVGTEIDSVRPLFGREIKSQTIVVTRYEPGHLLSYAAVVPLIGRTTGDFTFESAGGGTRLSRDGDVSLGRAEGLLGPTLARVLRSGWGTELSNLKRLVEAEV